jgi:serine protease Do
VVAALFSERGGPAALAADLDRRVMPAPPEEARRLPWLGVEHEGLDRRVAQALGVSGPTLDGARGRIVTVVYPSSPAARAGLREGDVLLSVRRTGGGAASPPVDLRDADPGSFADGGSEVPRLWRPRLCGLVRLLDAWGVGTAYDLTFARDGEPRTVPLVVERAPRDWTTALRARDRAAGLSVREATYEVRQALRMAADAPGVVVAAVEEGSPAAQARLQPNEVLREADGRALGSPEDFAAALAAAREAGRASARVVVLRLGRSRFVDLRLSDAPPPAPTRD